MERMSRPDPAQRYRICVLCTGNICRSPMAEVILRQQLEEAGLGDRVLVDSAGTGDWHVGDPADPRTIKTLREHGYDGSAHRASVLTGDQLLQRDLVLVADEGHRRAVQELARDADADADIQLLRSFDPAAVAAGTLEVDDPYFGDGRDFERCLVEVRDACAGIVRHLAGLSG